VPRTFFLLFIVVIITFPFAGLLYLLTFVIKNQQVFSKFLRAWANVILWFSGLKINVTGLENIDKNREFVVIANHESSLDIFLGIGKIPLQIRMVSKDGVKKLPIIGGLMTRLYFVFLDLTNPKKAIKQLNDSMKVVIEKKLSLFIFPEGTRIKDVPLKPFKKGAFVLASRENLPILPVILRNTGKITPPGTMWFRKQNVDVEILPAISTEKYSTKNVDELRDYCFNIYKEKL
ncbi:MAG: lysophospholipid acyltransferase family protein, partial [Candidatus Marinimicrobia bacterium]|nr:lysophospholipid acyltransferase family protein [Candidatus Neomarinimicrobiota bacterium]